MKNAACWAAWESPREDGPVKITVLYGSYNGREITFPDEATRKAWLDAYIAAEKAREVEA